MMVKMLVLCVFYLSAFRTCHAVDGEDSNITASKGNIQVDGTTKQDPIILKEKKLGLENIAIKPNLNLRLNSEETASKNVKKPSRPVSKLQQEIQILQPKIQEAKSKGKPIMVSALQPKLMIVPGNMKKNQKLVTESKSKSDTILSNEQNKKSKVNVLPISYDDDENYDDLDDKESKTESSEEKLQPNRAESKKEEMKLSNEKNKSKDKEIPKTEESSDLNETSKSNNTNVVDDSHHVDENVLVNDDHKAHTGDFVQIENIVSEMTPVKNVEEAIDSPSSDNLFSEIKHVSTVNTTPHESSNESSKINNAKPILASEDHGGTAVNFRKSSNQKAFTDLLSNEDEILPVLREALQPFNLLNEPGDQLVINNEEVGELSVKPNFGNQIVYNNNPHFETNPEYYASPYNNYATYDNSEQIFKWQYNDASSRNYYNGNQCWPNSGYPFTYNWGNYVNSQNHKPDNSYTRPPYQYPYEEQLRNIIDAFSKQGNQKNTSKKSSTTITNNGWNQHYNSYYPNQNQPLYNNNKISNPLSYYNYNEVKMPYNNLDRTWRHWHKTQVIVNSNKKRRPYQQNLERLGRNFA